LEQEDLVAWLSIGLTHYPHAEDVPVTVTSSNHASFWVAPYNYFGRDPASALRDTVVLRPDPKTGAAIPDKDPMALKPAADCTYRTADVPYRGPATAA
jgi:primary-amine oxidase